VIGCNYYKFCRNRKNSR